LHSSFILSSMKVTRAQATENHRRVLKIAATLYRERGFDGVGIAELMKSAGLTHGGFYGQFSSKKDLQVNVCSRTFADQVDHWRKVVDEAVQAGGDPLSAVAAKYLSKRLRDQPGTGCLMAALGPEVSRQGSSVRRVVTKGVVGLVTLFARVAPGKSPRAKRELAIGTYATLVGALVLARAVNDSALSDEILNGAFEYLTQRSNRVASKA
jgi:TetR/AcrR family transcriptional regulator, transcriptional repressor for nem operon